MWEEEDEKKYRERRVFAGIFLLMLIAFAFVLSAVYTVDQTEMAVVKQFGKVHKITGPGLHFKIPVIQTVDKYYVGVRTLNLVGKEDVVALSNDGLEIHMDISVQTAIKPEIVETIAKTFRNPQYLETWKIATVRATIRDVIAKYQATDLYGEKRKSVEADITRELEKELSKYYYVKAVWIRKITLPQRVKEAIEAKIQAQQEAERMKYIVQREKLEAERKKVEAEGIAQANAIIGESLRKNPEYIQWYFMKSLEEMAKNPNTIFLVVPIPSSYFGWQGNLTQIPQIPVIIQPQPYRNLS